jgi:uncharacterized protein YutD
MKKIEINGVKYEIVQNDNGCLVTDDLVEKITDYFDPYDYIFGDYAYDKVRLKGFYDSSNKNAKKINDIKYLNDYKKDFCHFGSKTFLLKKIK